MFGVHCGDQIEMEHLEDIAEESLHIEPMVCDECGEEIQEGDWFWEFNGEIFCENCCDEHRHTR